MMIKVVEWTRDKNQWIQWEKKSWKIYIKKNQTVWKSIITEITLKEYTKSNQ